MMNFENQRVVEEEEEEMEEEEEEEDDEDEAHLAPTNYESSLPNSSSRPFKLPVEARSHSESLSPPPLPLSLSFPAGKRPIGPARYRECLKNHAVGIGGHAVDGCCEFMPAGPEGSMDALKCAACNCHRNFHRKEMDSSSPQQMQPPVNYFSPHQHQDQQNQLQQASPSPHPLFQLYPYGRAPPPPPGGGYPRPLMALPSTSGGGRRVAGEGEEAEMIMEPMSAMGLGKKRHRTKFTADQKEKMLELAEKVGWRLQKQDEPLIQEFCDLTGIKRHVLKVWMHNNKHTLGKRNPTTT